MTVVGRAVRLSLPVLALLALATIASAQESDVKRYAVDVPLEPAAHAATIRTTQTVWNPTDAPKRFEFLCWLTIHSGNSTGG